jgi:hypothetical protein
MPIQGSQGSEAFYSATLSCCPYTLGKDSNGGKPKNGQQYSPAVPPAHRSPHTLSTWKLLTSILNSSTSLVPWLDMNADVPSLTSNTKRSTVIRWTRQRNRLLHQPPRHVTVVLYGVLAEVGLAAAVVDIMREHAHLPVGGLDDGDVLLAVPHQRWDLRDGEPHGGGVEHEPPVGEAVHPVEAVVSVVSPVPDGVDGAAEQRPPPTPHEAVWRRECWNSPCVVGDRQNKDNVECAMNWNVERILCCYDWQRFWLFSLHAYRNEKYRMTLGHTGHHAWHALRASRATCSVRGEHAPGMCPPSRLGQHMTHYSHK